MKNYLDDIIKEKLDKVMEIRRELHQIPELGFEEFKTNEVIKRELDKAGIKYKTGIAKTGIVALIEGKEKGKTVLLRADMDALPLEEESNYEFKSKIKGKMHACGHDGHTASLLGTALVLNEIKDKIKGNIKFVFQPAEEGPFPGGAYYMVEEGVLENPKVDAAFGCHVWPAYKAGHVVIKEGAMMSDSTSFDVIIQGKGGHGSLPEKSIDPIVIGCQVVNNFQNIISREISTLTPAVLSCCSIHSGETYNVIPDKLSIKGTIRTFDEEVTKEILDKMESVLKGIKVMYNADYEFNIIRMYPALKNNDSIYNFTKQVFEEIFEKDKIEIMKEPLMGSEDFSHYARKVPSNFFLVGIKEDQKEEELLLHHPKLNWNEKNLEVSMRAFVNLAVNYLNKM